MTAHDATPTPHERVTLNVDQHKFGVQLSINTKNKNGSGHGYRISGPKYDGTSRNIAEVTLTPRDADEIRAYLEKVSPESTHAITTKKAERAGTGWYAAELHENGSLVAKAYGHTELAANMRARQLAAALAPKEPEDV